eukprot:1160396-Pelagomonas_calceolata.AAC.26
MASPLQPHMQNIALSEQKSNNTIVLSIAEPALGWEYWTPAHDKSQRQDLNGKLSDSAEGRRFQPGLAFPPKYLLALTGTMI